MKDLFVGALGRVNNHGGSRIYTTPNTVKVEPEYFINVSYNIQGDLIAHSLDGRLWLYRRSRRLGVIALRWSKENSRLEYAAAKNFSNNDDVALACGLDWVLTNNNIFMASDSAPYILQSPLFADDIPDTYLYSFLRAGSVGASGVDPFTNEAWGKREDNGNSEGTGYFSKSTHLLYPAGTHSMEHCYSLLPAVGDWQIVENFLVRRPDAESLDSYNYMQSMRPLIPLELRNGSEPLYGTGYNFDHRGIQLACVDGQLCGRGARNIGKVYILPAVFAEDGSVQEYYLYISPDYVCENVDVWLDIGLVDTAHGFFSQQVSPVTGGLCEKAQNTSLFNLQTKQWDNLSENNGSLFVDAVSSRGIVLDEAGMKLLKEGEIETFTCATLPQWVAPAGKVEAVDNDSVVASVDNAVLRTSLTTGFNRELITPNTLPLSGTIFEGSGGQKFRVAVHEDSSGTRKAFDVNSLAARSAGVQNIPWENVYKNAVSFKDVITVTEPFWEILDGYPLIIASENITAMICPYHPEYGERPGDGDYLWGDQSLIPYSGIVGYGDTAVGNLSTPGFSHSCNANLFYVSYESGEIIHVSINAEFSSHFPSEIDYSYTPEGRIRVVSYDAYAEGAVAEIPERIGISEGKIGYFYSLYIGGLRDIQENLFKPCIDFPKELSRWSNDNTRLILQRISSTPHVAVFSEKFSRTIFLCEANLDDDVPSWSVGYGNFWDNQSNKGLHFAISYHSFLVFRSQLHPEIFDFDAELERSKLS